MMLRWGLLALNCYFLTGRYNPAADSTMQGAAHIIAFWVMLGNFAESTSRGL